MTYSEFREQSGDLSLQLRRYNDKIKRLEHQNLSHTELSPNGLMLLCRERDRLKSELEALTKAYEEEVRAKGQVTSIQDGRK